jgi:putative SOS response-associated peptidase YedK
VRTLHRYLPWSEIQRLYRLTTDWEKRRNDAPAYNMAPTDPVPFVTAGENAPTSYEKVAGGWFPWWAKEMPKNLSRPRRLSNACTTLRKRVPAIGPAAVP